MTFQKILVPYDGSSFSDRAFKAALDLAQKYDSKITIVSCIDIFSSRWFGKSICVYLGFSYKIYYFTTSPGLFE